MAGSPGCVGDLVVLLDAGGYTLEMMSDHNAGPRAGAHAITLAGEVVEIRRRESHADPSALNLTPGAEA